MTQTPNNTDEDKVHVLVVDDSRVMRRAMDKILKNDAILLEAEDGEKGWELLLQNSQIQVLITDIEMPKLDGYGLICRIRAYTGKRVREIPIITITGADDEETKARAYACGATDFIIKPLDALQLVARVRAHAKLDDTTRQLAQTTTTLEIDGATDPLTHLNSRRYFLQRMEQELAHAKRHTSPLSLIRVDIDDFKDHYRTHGDMTADKILVWIAENTKQSARAEDTVARVGGAEFAILAPSTGKTEATVMCERLRCMIESDNFRDKDSVIPLTVSVGLVTYGADQGENLEQLLLLSEERLRDAKAEGGNRVSVTIRSELMPDPEEVVLDAPPPETEVAIEFDPDPEPQRHNVVNLNQQQAAEPVTLTQAEPERQQLAESLTLPVDMIDLNRAVQLLSEGQGMRIAPYALHLAQNLMPLLEFCDKNHTLDLAQEIAAIEKKIKAALKQ